MKCNIIGTEKIQSVVIKHKGSGLMAKLQKRFDKYPVYASSLIDGAVTERDIEVKPYALTGILEIEVEDFVEVTDLITMLERFIDCGQQKIGRFKESEEE